MWTGKCLTHSLYTNIKCVCVCRDQFIQVSWCCQQFVMFYSFMLCLKGVKDELNFCLFFFIRSFTIFSKWLTDWLDSCWNVEIMINWLHCVLYGDHLVSVRLIAIDGHSQVSFICETVFQGENFFMCGNPMCHGLSSCSSTIIFIIYHFFHLSSVFSFAKKK